MVRRRSAVQVRLPAPGVVAKRFFEIELTTALFFIRKRREYAQNRKSKIHLTPGDNAQITVAATDTNGIPISFSDGAEYTLYLTVKRDIDDATAIISKSAESQTRIAKQKIPIILIFKDMKIIFRSEVTADMLQSLRTEKRRKNFSLTYTTGVVFEKVNKIVSRGIAQKAYADEIGFSLCYRRFSLKIRILTRCMCLIVQSPV